MNLKVFCSHWPTHRKNDAMVESTRPLADEGAADALSLCKEAPDMFTA
jgi:hypothetical protein